MRDRDRQSGEDVKARFGAAVRSRRRELGISQDALAERSGLHRTYIAETEAGKRNVALQNVERIAAGLDLTLGELFALVDSQSPAGSAPDGRKPENRA